MTPRVRWSWWASSTRWVSTSCGRQCRARSSRCSFAASQWVGSRPSGSAAKCVLAPGRISCSAPADSAARSGVPVRTATVRVRSARSASRRSVPPQPISTSSGWAPTHSTSRGPSGSRSASISSSLPTPAVHVAGEVQAERRLDGVALVGGDPGPTTGAAREGAGHRRAQPRLAAQRGEAVEQLTEGMGSLVQLGDVADRAGETVGRRQGRPVAAAPSRGPRRPGRRRAATATARRSGCPAPAGRRPRTWRGAAPRSGCPPCRVRPPRPVGASGGPAAHRPAVVLVGDDEDGADGRLLVEHRGRAGQCVTAQRRGLVQDGDVVVRSRRGGGEVVVDQDGVHGSHPVLPPRRSTSQCDPGSPISVTPDRRSTGHQPVRSTGLQPTWCRSGSMLSVTSSS